MDIFLSALYGGGYAVAYIGIPLIILIAILKSFGKQKEGIVAPIGKPILVLIGVVVLFIILLHIFLRIALPN